MFCMCIRSGSPHNVVHFLVNVVSWLTSSPVDVPVALADELVTQHCKTGAHSPDSPVDPMRGATMPAEAVLLES